MVVLGGLTGDSSRGRADRILPETEGLKWTMVKFVFDDCWNVTWSFGEVNSFISIKY